MERVGCVQWMLSPQHVERVHERVTSKLDVHALAVSRVTP